MNKYIIKDINCLANDNIVSVNDARTTKMHVLEQLINTKRHSYNIVGFVDRTTEAVLQPTYYNVRNSKGRFAAVKKQRNSR